MTEASAVCYRWLGMPMARDCRSLVYTFFSPARSNSSRLPTYSRSADTRARLVGDTAETFLVCIFFHVTESP